MKKKSSEKNQFGELSRNKLEIMNVFAIGIHVNRVAPTKNDNPFFEQRKLESLLEWEIIQIITPNEKNPLL